jgi:hypothetical protein
MLLAGVDGIRNKIEPATPIDKDLYELPPDERADVDIVPTSLGAVMDSLEADHEFLLAGRRVHAGPDRHVDRVQAHPGDPADLAAARTRTSSSSTTTSRNRASAGL